MIIVNPVRLIITDDLVQPQGPANGEINLFAVDRDYLSIESNPFSESLAGEEPSQTDHLLAPHKDYEISGHWILRATDE